MKTLRFKNEANTLNQFYLVDLIDDNEELTIYQAKYFDDDGNEQIGLKEDAIKQGFFPYPDIDEYNINAMVEWAEDNNYTLVIEEEGEDDITKNTATALAYTDPTLVAAKNDVVYSRDLALNGETELVTGGNGLYSFSLNDASDDLPEGMGLTTEGILYGTPKDTAGTFSLKFDVTDALDTVVSSGSVSLVLAASDKTDFLTFSLADQTGDATIDTEAHTIAIEVENGTTVTALVATFSLDYEATVKVDTTLQASGITANNFTSAVTYSVTAEDETATQDWTVTVTVA